MAGADRSDQECSEVVGRDRELAELERAIASTRGGQSVALVISGEPGIGKTELLRHVAESAKGFTQLAVRGVENETDLAFAGVADVVRPLSKLLERLPEHHQAALRAAVGRASSSGQPGDRFVIYTATLGLLSLAAEEAPVLLTVDDAHWLDGPSTEAFVFAARRLEHAGILALFALRDEEPGAEAFKALPALKLKGLDSVSTGSLFESSSARHPTGPEVDRIHRLTRGNPLAVRELGRMVAEEGRDAGATLTGPVSLGPIVESAFRRRIDRLDERARLAVVVAASSDNGRMAEIVQALRTFGLEGSDLERAEDASLIRIAEGILEFEHPVLRAVAYESAPASQRRKIHRALADALPEDEDLERRAWHLAQASVEPSEAVAALTEQAGQRALVRSGYSSAASLFKLSASLTPSNEAAVKRSLRAGQAAQLAGQSQQAITILSEALTRTDDVALRSEIEQTRGRVYMWWQHPMKGHEILVRQARQIAEADPVKAALLMSEAAGPCFMAAQLDLALKTAQEGVRLAAGSTGQAGVMVDAILAEALTLVGRANEAEPLVDKVAGALDTDPSLAMNPAMNFLTLIEVALERYEAARRHLALVVEAGRQLGAASLLPYNLAVLSELEFRTGNWAAAYAVAAESVRLADETGQESVKGYSLVTLARVEAASGREEGARRHIAESVRVCEEHGTASIRTYASAATGFLELGLGNLEKAVTALQQTADLVAGHGLGDPGLVPWQPDFVEALIRTGNLDEADEALQKLEHQSHRTGRRWAQSAAARCRGLLAAAQQKEFERWFESAVGLADERFDHFEIARAELCYGEALRRVKQHTRAREHLRAALTRFDRLGATPWSEKARAELIAAGDRAVPRMASRTGELSPQELQVALAVAQGLTNREVANRLFLSPKTIESHLARVYSKLSIRSRSQLVHHFATNEGLRSA